MIKTGELLPPEMMKAMREERFSVSHCEGRYTFLIEIGCND